MAEPQNPLPAEPKVQKPAFELTPLDTALYSGATGGVLATQAYSRTHPTLARKVSENVLGVELAAGAPKGHRFAFPKTFLLYAGPAPIGIAPPEAFGLDYNYGRTMQLNLRDKLGIDTTSIPPSELLHNLPDTDPRVKYHEFKRRADIDRNIASQIIGTYNFQEASDLYTLALSPQADTLFADPAFVAERARQRLAATAPTLEEFSRVEFDIRTARRFDLNLPAPGALPTAVPSPLGIGDVLPPVPVIGQEQLPEQLVGIRGLVAPAGLDTPPTDARAAGAFDRAPPLVKHLASERNDP